MTTAERIAKRFGNDGKNWVDDGGTTLQDVCREQCIFEDDSPKHSATRFVFRDNSAIVAYGGGWDLGYETCYCGHESGHIGDCQYSPESQPDDE